MIGRRRNAGSLADHPHRLVAVHLRHHDVHQHDRDVGRRLEHLDRLAAGARRSAPPCRAARARCVSAKMLRTSSSTTSTLLADAGRRRSGAAARASAASRRGRSATTRCRKSAVSSSSRSGDSTPLTTTLARQRVQPRVLLGGQLLAGEDDDRQVAQRRRRRCMLLEQLEAGHVRQPQVEHHAVERLARAAPRAPPRRCRPAAISTSSWPSSSRDAQLLGGVVLDDQQPLARAARRSP